MIFVTVGSSHFPFDRLLHALDGLETVEEVVVQHGPSTVRPRGALCVPFLSFADFARHARQARVMVCHGGIGSVLVALSEGKRPLVVPRLARFRETTDDHQLESVRALAAAGLVLAVHEPLELPQLLAGTSEEVSAPPAIGGHLVDELRDFIRASVRRAPAGAVS